VALLVGLTLSLGLASGIRAATTWTMCARGCDYSSIKAAIAAPTTLDGDTLAIGAGTYTEAGILVTKSLTLQGAGAARTIVQAADTQGATSNRVFGISSGVTVTIQKLTIRYGLGGLYNMGRLTLTDSIIRDNNSLPAPFASGGGLYNPGTLTLINSTISGNSAFHGGGLKNTGTLMLINSTVSGNSSATSGGGLVNSGTLTLMNSTVSGNSASYEGGGLFNYSGMLTLTNSIVASNLGGETAPTKVLSVPTAITWTAIRAAS
jgi:hypothetical protein